MFLMWHALCIWLAVACDLSEYRQKGWKLFVLANMEHLFKKIMYMSSYTVFLEWASKSLEKDFWNLTKSGKWKKQDE